MINYTLLDTITPSDIEVGVEYDVNLGQFGYNAESQDGRVVVVKGNYEGYFKAEILEGCGCHGVPGDVIEVQLRSPFHKGMTCIAEPLPETFEISFSDLL